MLSLASEIFVGSSNESIAINIDIVNPIPAKKPTPKICPHDEPSGKELILNLVQIYDTNNIPTGFPRSKPNAIPKLRSDIKPETIVDSNVIFVFANANNGIIIKFTGLRSEERRVGKE